MAAQDDSFLITSRTTARAGALTEITGRSRYNFNKFFNPQLDGWISQKVT